jgi:hypothetical protein
VQEGSGIPPLPVRAVGLPSRSHSPGKPIMNLRFGAPLMPDPTRSEEPMNVREPNLFVLHNYGLQVTLATTSLTGQPQLTYNDAAQARQFTGEEITFADTVFGRLASVVLTSVPDLGTTTFSLVVPTVNLPTSGAQPISTIGITAVHRTTIAGPPPGQSTTLHVAPLRGTADQVAFVAAPPAT